MEKVKIVPPPSTLSVSSSGNIVDDVYNAFSIRVSSLTNRRPVWVVNFTVDQISFYIGALGGIGMAYLMSQYDLQNIDNMEYFNHDDRESPPNVFLDLIRHIITNPLHIVHRFFVSGSVYCLIGLATSRIFRQDGWMRPLTCGSFTGLYFTNGGTFMDRIKGAVGFSVFALLMEGFFSIATR
ncbi:uncharacterized protein LOC110846793 [Folsomia candida]|uniref:Uncharacterized protein n=1 Tax=Folsomia candida TaxID=158441 RepID=A0A226EKH6_FOLCA|nr:uncharacterized protein LOC110846793 [Folsomia candida]OXA57959.1 hypothetical protein Fcan01_07181 [Folsomia candida]